MYSQKTLNGRMGDQRVLRPGRTGEKGSGVLVHSGIIQMTVMTCTCHKATGKVCTIKK
jgi:hypothetical protein